MMTGLSNRCLTVWRQVLWMIIHFLDNVTTSPFVTNYRLTSYLAIATLVRSSSPNTLHFVTFIHIGHSNPSPLQLLLAS